MREVSVIINHQLQREGVSNMAGSTVAGGRLLKPGVSRVGMFIIANMLGLLISVLLAPGSAIFPFTALMSLWGFVVVYGPMVLMVAVEYYLLRRYGGRVSDVWFFAGALVVALVFYWVYIPIG